MLRRAPQPHKLNLAQRIASSSHSHSQNTHHHHPFQSVIETIPIGHGRNEYQSNATHEIRLPYLVAGIIMYRLFEEHTIHLQYSSKWGCITATASDDHHASMLQAQQYTSSGNNTNIIYTNDRASYGGGGGGGNDIHALFLLSMIIAISIRCDSYNKCTNTQQSKSYEAHGFD